MKKMLSLYVILCLISTILAACNPAAPASSAEPITIYFYKRGFVEGGTDASSVTVTRAVSLFEQSHPKIKVKVTGVPWGPDGTTQLETALENKLEISVFSVNAVDLARYARAGYLSALDAYLTDEDKADFYTSGLQAATVDGKIVAWPLWVTTVSIYANNALFAERGVTMPSLEDPWTWEEFTAAAQQLTFTRADGVQVYGFSASSKPGLIVYFPLLYLDGGRVVSPDGKQFIQDSPGALSALQKLADLTAKYHVTPPDFSNVEQQGVHEQYLAGTVAMIMETPAFIAELEKQGAAFTILPPPTGKAGQIITTGAFGLYAVAPGQDEAHLQASHEFARYLTSSQIAVDIPGYQLAPGLRKSNTAYATTPNRAIVARLVSFGLYEAPVSITPELRLRWETALAEIALSLKTPEQAIAEIATDYQKELDASNP